MAKVSAHGREIGTVYFTTSAKRYMSDGVILKNTGRGWKLAGKLKDGVTPQAAYEAQVERQKAHHYKFPELARYRKLLHDAAGLGKRWKLHAAIQMMPDDADGVWSECCDGYGDNCSCDVDEVYRLCHAYQATLKAATREAIEKPLADIVQS
jgi:hypothetical protein